MIIGILAGIGIAQYKSYINKAKSAKIISDLSQISKILQTDRIARNKSDFSYLQYDESGQERDGAIEVVRIIKEAGFKLPDSNDACYMIMPLRRFKGVNLKQGTEWQDFAVVSLRAEAQSKKFTRPYPKFGEVIFASGTSRAVKILSDLSLTPAAKSGLNWAEAIHSYRKLYKNCQRDNRWKWNGVVVESSPFYNIFSMAPIDPSL